VLDANRVRKRTMYGGGDRGGGEGTVVLSGIPYFDG